MNTRELIEKINKIAIDTPFQNSKIVDHLEVIKLIEQLDEPEKIVVSEEEAKFLRTFDFNCESDVTTALYHVSRTGCGYHLMDRDGTELKDLSEGFRELENRKRLIRAILFGYEVEKEKRYLVKIIGIKDYDSYLNYRKEEKVWTIESELEVDTIRTGHTRKQLEEANFGWVFNCEGIEVEEVAE